MKAKLIKEKLDFNREGTPLKKIGIGMGIKGMMLKIAEILNNFNILAYYREDENGVHVLNLKDESGYIEGGYLEDEMWELDYVPEDFFGLEENEKSGLILFYGSNRKGEFDENWESAISYILNLKFGKIKDMNSKISELQYNLNIINEVKKNREKLNL